MDRLTGRQRSPACAIALFSVCAALAVSCAGGDESPNMQGPIGGGSNPALGGDGGIPGVAPIIVPDSGMPDAGTGLPTGLGGTGTAGGLTGGTVRPPTGGGTAGLIGGLSGGLIGGLIGGGATGGLIGGAGGFTAGGFTGGGALVDMPVMRPALPPPAAEDGDPSQPIVSVPGVACGPNSSLFGLTSTNVQIGGRDVHVAYPCNKHKRAPVQFILNLHGTMDTEELKLYQVAYFAANELVNSHNLITVAPKSVVSQWGNGDGGKDEPHLKAVIEWVYSTFKDFDIRGMWVTGHSYGAMYSTTYVCKPEIADRVIGTVLMSTFPTLPACATRISVINTNAEMDIASPLPQGDLPAKHGCDAPVMNMLGNNTQTLWPNCKNGFVHSNYLMLGKAHADYIDAEVVKSICDLIKAARP
jgi:hypothetical protein